MTCEDNGIGNDGKWIFIHRSFVEAEDAMEATGARTTTQRSGNWNTERPAANSRDSEVSHRMTTPTARLSDIFTERAPEAADGKRTERRSTSAVIYLVSISFGNYQGPVVLKACRKKWGCGRCGDIIQRKVPTEQSCPGAERIEAEIIHPGEENGLPAYKGGGNKCG